MRSNTTITHRTLGHASHCRNSSGQTHRLARESGVRPGSPASALSGCQTVKSEHTVNHFRQIILWPLQLMPLADNAGQHHWELLEQNRSDSPWRRVENKFTGNKRSGGPGFQERYYKEFVTFPPYVQRFLYGESRSLNMPHTEDPPGDSALKIFRRHDVAALRLTLHTDAAPILLAVPFVGLYFFDDIDVVFLKVEVTASHLPLTTVRDIMYRFGRAYPTGWDDVGQGVHNAAKVEWLATDGHCIASSDFDNRDKFLSFTRWHRAPCSSSHWAFLLRPLALDPSEEVGEIRYRQIEHHRMPLMAYVAVDDPRSISREEWIRLGLIATLHPEEPIPIHDSDVTEFNIRYCYDRFWTNTDTGSNTRYLCSGRALIVVGDARESYFLNSDRGILAHFRHQYFILFLIAHLHRAALLIFSDRLVDAIHDMDIKQASSVNKFRQRIHSSFDAFLRFTHRYWFHEISERPHMQSLFRLCSNWLGNDALYDEVKEELRDMSQYLDSDAQRRQSTTVVRLTVVTTISLVGTVATGFLGMNIIDEANAPILLRWSYFFLTILGTVAFVLFSIMKSRRLSELMDILSDNRTPLRTRFALIAASSRQPRP
ncbi:MAG: hypothetical protein HQL63_03505 [Magnetococcales bacterium]|nr:hypothetical protein [Magnetococcales bacterium]MBF0321727.1 hypothetical protein [Magnetococcales bacterium]